MRVVSFSGKSGHGKDFCAEVLRDLLDEEGKHLALWSFGHPLKATVYSEARGWYPFEDVWYRKPPELRKKLQVRGTEEGRNRFGTNVWTLQSEAFLRIFDTWGFVDAVAIPDARFPNELEFARLGGQVSETLMQRIQQEALEEIDLTEELEEYLLSTNPSELYQLEQQFSTIVEARYEAERKHGVVVRVRSDRPTLTGEAALHASETSLDHIPDTDFDFVIQNNLDTSLEDLKEQLRPVAAKLLSR